MGRFVQGALAALALTGCATAPMPYSRPLPTGLPPPPPGPSIFDSAPHAEVRSELLACSASGSNIGPLGDHRQSLEYTPYIQTAAGALLRDPTESVCLSSGFGYRTLVSVGTGGGAAHTGIDLANANGGWVFAAGDGWVTSEAYRGGYGLVVELDHGQGVHTLYAHLNEVNPHLRPGMFVRSGEAIARMGRTGNATGVHLHYELIVDGVKRDPLAYGTPYENQAPYVPPTAQITEVGQPAPADNALPPDASKPSDQSGASNFCDPDAAYDPNATCVWLDGSQ
jgi:murein DD-endopeptidase MepM/ murein hydrolase activator NlpD